MMGRLRTHITYANVMSSLALFLVVAGGTAVAAQKLARNSVGTTHLRDSSILTRDLAFPLGTAQESSSDAQSVPVDGEFRAVARIADFGAVHKPVQESPRSPWVAVVGAVFTLAEPSANQPGCRLTGRLAAVRKDGKVTPVGLPLAFPYEHLPSEFRTISLHGALAPSATQRKRGFSALLLQVRSDPSTCKSPVHVTGTQLTSQISPASIVSPSM